MGDIRPGDILLFKGEGGMSSIIAWGTNSLYTHVAVCVSGDMSLAIEAATRGGVRAIDIRKAAGRFDLFRVKEENLYDINRVVSYLVDKLNGKYDYPGVIWLGILKLMSKLGVPLKNKANLWQKTRDYFCSELCYEAFSASGLDIVPDVSEADITSPADIANSSIIAKIS